MSDLTFWTTGTPNSFHLLRSLNRRLFNLSWYLQQSLHQSISFPDHPAHPYHMASTLEFQSHTMNVGSTPLMEYTEGGSMRIKSPTLTTGEDSGSWSQSISYTKEILSYRKIHRRTSYL